MDEPQYRVWMEEPVRPRAYLRRAARPLGRRAAWPSPNIKPQLLALNAGGRLGGQAGAESAVETLSPQSLGEACGAWCGFGIGPERPLDQRVDDGRSICFDSEPLPERLEILGAPR